MAEVAAPPVVSDGPPAAAPAAKVVDPVDKYAALVVRGTIVGMGLLGTALFLRNSRIFAKFESASQIPKEFIRKELELKGKIREVLPTGELRIEHEPIIRLPRLLPRKKNAKVGLLTLRLAGLDISKAGTTYITKDLRLTNKPVTFTVIKGSDAVENALDADVTIKKSVFVRTNLNVDLVRRGYARVPPPEHPSHLKALQSVPAYSRLIQKLLMSEKVKVADRRGVGVWERDTWVETMQSYPSAMGGIIRANPVTKFVVLLFNVSRDLAVQGVKLTQQTWSLILATCAMVAAGYRRFAAGVDRATAAYNRVKQRLK
ncbi:hypothetical protein PRIPAC_87369 [Pristionchus pacificus]|uniref:Uncharacterized protein n=1 Tax=Pristionchus pacificus TaxID=54126 RepID=A0A2A6B5T2_PRIPA|nr:hypothetical protein PRIPAC_87369 [Pristionchus pacificus]|eukprot:PDM61236.1 hypothetical protein PRIPAC_50678 [Pristionchus pacificus]